MIRPPITPPTIPPMAPLEIPEEVLSHQLQLPRPTVQAGTSGLKRGHTIQERYIQVNKSHFPYPLSHQYTAPPASRAKEGDDLRTCIGLLYALCPELSRTVNDIATPPATLHVQFLEF
jgi:hypothetical protein